MYTVNIFSTRIKSIRTTHNLSIGELSNLLNIKSKSNIFNWETGKNIPSLTLFQEITTLFGVSADWLLGNVDNPYNADFILKIERSLLSANFELNGACKPFLGKGLIPDTYFDEKQRIKLYSLPLRANIIFLLHNHIAFVMAALTENQTAIQLPLGKHLITLHRYYEILCQPEIYTKKALLRSFYSKTLHKLLNTPQSDPVFDINKTTEE